MFIRWKRRRLGPQRGARSANRPPRYSLDAVLVRAERVNGQPRQRVVRYLGSFPESYLSAIGAEQSFEGIGATALQLQFWRAVDWHLADLGLDEATCELLAAKIAERVPRPTSAAIERRAEILQFERALMAGQKPW
jgi:hypothetical protein